MRKAMRVTVVTAAMVATHLMGVSMARVMAAPSGPEQLEAEAVAMQSKTDTKSWYKAAVLYQRAAELRAPGDAIAVKHLIRAANLLYHVKRHAEAMQVMEQAGDRAIAAGDVLQAAQAYAGVAWIAERSGQSKLARRFVEKVQLLAGSPLLDSDARRSISRLVVLSR